MGADYTPEALKERIDFTLDSVSCFWYGSVRKDAHFMSDREFGELPNKQERIFLSSACKKAKRKKIFDNERKPVEKHDIYIFRLEKCSGSRILLIIAVCGQSF